MLHWFAYYVSHDNYVVIVVDTPSVVTFTLLLLRIQQHIEITQALYYILCTYGARVSLIFKFMITKE